MELGQRIGAWRRFKGWTQKELAGRLKVSRAAVCMWEGNGDWKQDPSTKNLNALVAAFGVSMARFYGRVPKPKKAAA